MPQNLVEILRPYDNPNFMNQRRIDGHINDFLRTNRATTNRPTNQATNSATNRIYQNNSGSRNNNQNRNWSNGK